MKKLRKLAGMTLAMLTACTMTLAQEKTDNGYNSNSVRPIHESNIMWKVRVWRRMDLKEKQNQPFFSLNNEITKYLMEGVTSGVLTAYKNDSLSTKLTKEQFLGNMKMDGISDGLSEEEKQAGMGGTGGTAAADDGWGGTPASTGTAAGATPAAPAATTEAFYFAKQLTILDIMEDIIFDKQRSRVYHDIQSLTIIIPANQTSKGFDVPVASFKYKELERYFRSNPKCIWYNSHNQAQHKNMADAFDLRLFFARLTKMSNPEDKDLNDIYKSDKAGLLKSLQMEHKLMELEHNLWEY
jgi:Gliding motility associated protein GldN